MVERLKDVARGINSNRGYLLLLLVGTYSLIIGSLVTWNFNPDDAYRYFHVAKNIYNGHGVRWNIVDAQPSQSFTSFLWILALVLVKGLSNLSFITIGKVLGLISSIVTLCVSSYFVYRKVQKNITQTAFVILGLITLPVFYFHTVNGMDTSLHMMFITLVSISFLLSWEESKYFRYFFLFSLLAFLLRYDSVLFLGVLYFTLLYRYWNKKSDYIKTSIPILFLPGFLYFCGKLVYFGGIFPNSIYVKTAETVISPSGIKYFIENFNRFFAIGAIAVICLYPYSRIGQKNKYIILFLSILLQTLFIIRIIPTVGQGGRFVFPYVPSFIIIIANFVIGTILSNGGKSLAEKILIIITIGALFLGIHLDSRYEHFRKMRRYASSRVYDPVIGKAFINVVPNPEDIVISTGESGAISYFSDFTLVDIWGLHDSYIAKNGIDPDYVFSYDPDVFATFIPTGILKIDDGKTSIDRKYMMDYINISKKNKNVRGHTAYSSFVIMVDERFDNYNLINSISIGDGKEWVFLLRKESNYYKQLEERINKIEFRNHMFAVDSSMSFNRYLQAFISPYDKSNFTFLDILY